MMDTHVLLGDRSPMDRPTMTGTRVCVRSLRCAAALVIAALAQPAFAGFTGTDTFVAAVARAPG